jgi:ribosomal protein S19
MVRSLKKFNYFSPRLYNKLKAFKSNLLEDLNEKQRLKFEKRLFGKSFFVIFSKNIIINELMVGFYFLVYNGLSYKYIFIKESMLGYKLGEFLVTKSLGMKIHMEKKNIKK